MLLGNGGTTAFWDAATFGLIDQRSQHLRFGEFSSKFAEAAAGRAVPRRARQPLRRPRHPPAPRRRPRDRRLLPHPQRDVHRRGHAARAPGRRRGPRARRRHLRRRRAALRSRTRSTSTTSPRRSAWRPTVASGSPPRRPPAIERIERIAASDRWVPASLDLGIALDNSRKDQTYNTPALATIFLANQQVEWINQQGGLEWAATRCDTSAATIYDWAEASALRHAVRGGPGAAQPRRRHHRPRRGGRRRQRRVRGAARQRRRSTPRATASSAATSCASPCSRRSTPPTSPPSPAASTTSSRRWREVLHLADPRPALGGRPRGHPARRGHRVGRRVRRRPLHGRRRRRLRRRRASRRSRRRPRSRRWPSPPTRLRLGTLVFGNTYRHPAVLANWAATVDQLSGGRLAARRRRRVAGERARAVRHRAAVPQGAHRPLRGGVPGLERPAPRADHHDRRHLLPAHRRHL